MWNRFLLAAYVLIGALSGLTPPHAHAAVVGFEGLDDSTPVTNQFVALGVTLSNATVLKVGISLNEAEYPPAGGDNVVFDDGGAMFILFEQPVTHIAAFLTYSVGVTVTAFDASDNPLGFISSAFSSNYVSSGNAPNEKLELSFSAGIARVSVLGSNIGGSFTLDNLTFDGTPLSQPGSLVLALLALLALAAASPLSKCRRAYELNH